MRSTCSMFRKVFFLRLNRIRCAAIGLLILILILTEKLHPLVILRDLGYLTRPVWDNPGKRPEILIPHFHADNMSFDQLCHFHSWKPRMQSKPKIIDAVIFSIELDILEVRIMELWNVVDLFIVIEADMTFTGQPKRLYLQENLTRFKWAKDKLIPLVLANQLRKNPQGSFQNEISMRQKMKEKILSLSQVNEGDLIVVSDTDEIPFPATLELLRSCEGYPDEIHLQMRNFLYSFEYYVDTNHWRPHVALYKRETFDYHHHNSKSTNQILADAGWHCSFCFRNIEDFVFKMTSYSHSDRVTSQHLLDPNEIQRKICTGSDVFDMFPEAYTFKELIAALGSIPKVHSTVGVPSSIIKNADKFRFLLPGGCLRNESRTKDIML